MSFKEDGSTSVPSSRPFSGYYATTDNQREINSRRPEHWYAQDSSTIATSTMVPRTSAGYGSVATAVADHGRPPAIIAPLYGSQDTLASLREYTFVHGTPPDRGSRIAGSWDHPVHRLQTASRRSPPSPSREVHIQQRPSLDHGRQEAALSEHGSWESTSRLSQDLYMLDSEPLPPQGQLEYAVSSTHSPTTERRRSSVKYHTQRKPSNRDEFDGPHQLLNPPSPRTVAEQERELLHLPTNLDVQEQDQILTRVNDILSKCAFDFVAKYQFPIPIEPDKRQVRSPSDREWTEWVYLLKRLATKRRIPARVLYNNQIKQLVTILENSLEMRHAAKHQSRPLKDDRNILQLISAGTQVAKILKDASAMDSLDRLYHNTEIHIRDRKDLVRRGYVPA